MVKNPNEQVTGPKQEKPKRRYARPVLENYGGVRALTEGGAGSTLDGQGIMASMNMGMI